MAETIEKRALRLYQESRKRLDDMVGIEPTTQQEEEVKVEYARLAVLEEVLQVEDEPRDN